MANHDPDNGVLLNVGVRRIEVFKLLGVEQSIIVRKDLEEALAYFAQVQM